MTSLWELPGDWRWATMGDVAKVVAGSTPKTGEPSYWNGEIPWITPDDLSGYTAKYIERGRRSITRAGYDSCSARMVPAGTVLFTSRAPIGYVAIAAKPVCTNQGFKSFVCGPDLDPQYVYWYLRSSTELAKAMASGTTFLEISGRAAAAIPIPVPPLLQQKRIAQILDQQLSRLEIASAGIRSARQRLVRYRDAVLFAASLGRVGAADHDPTGDGSPPGDATSGLPRLPEDWRWTTFAEVAKRVTVGHVGPMKSEYVDNGIPFLRSQNVRANRFDPAGLKYIRPEFHRRLAKSRLLPGDVVVVRSGDVGTACVIPDELPEANCADLVIIQRPTEIHPRFAAYYLNSAARRLIAAGRVGVALIHFNTRSVAELPVPLPPSGKQSAIVDEVESRLSVIDTLEREVDLAERRAVGLRRALLQAAMRGQLGTS